MNSFLCNVILDYIYIQLLISFKHWHKQQIDKIADSKVCVQYTVTCHLYVYKASEVSPLFHFREQFLSVLYLDTTAFER